MPVGVVAVQRAGSELAKRRLCDDDLANPAQGVVVEPRACSDNMTPIPRNTVGTTQGSPRHTGIWQRAPRREERTDGPVSEPEEGFGPGALASTKAKASQLQSWQQSAAQSAGFEPAAMLVHM